MTRNMFLEAHFRRYRVLNDMALQRYKAEVLAAFPETGGSGHLMHNWYRCGKDPVKREVADRIEERLQRAYRYLHKRRTREYSRILHVDHSEQFKPLWCEHCQRKASAKSGAPSLF